jgi:hypothetical protein
MTCDRRDIILDAFLGSGEHRHRRRAHWAAPLEQLEVIELHGPDKPGGALLYPHTVGNIFSGASVPR